MTTPQQQPPPLDTGNALLGEGPAQMTAALLETPGGQRLALTIRTSSATTTVFLNHGDAVAWGRNLLATANQMSRSGLIVAAGRVNGSGKAAG